MRCSGNVSAIRAKLRYDPEGAKEEIRRAIDRHHGNLSRMCRDFFLCRRAAVYLVSITKLGPYAMQVRQKRRQLWRKGPEWLQHTREALK